MAPLAFAALIKRGEKACGLPKEEKTMRRPFDRILQGRLQQMLSY